MISMGFDRYGLDKRQPIVGFIVLILTVVWAITLNQKAGSPPMVLVAGLMIAYTLTRSSNGSQQVMVLYQHGKLPVPNKL